MAGLGPVDASVEFEHTQNEHLSDTTKHIGTHLMHGKDTPSATSISQLPANQVNGSFCDTLRVGKPGVSNCVSVIPDSKPDSQHRPHVMPSYIPVPKVDNEVVARQSEIFRSIWPALTHQAVVEFPEFAERYALIKSFNLPNFLGARLTIPSALNFTAWETHLSS